HRRELADRRRRQEKARGGRGRTDQNGTRAARHAGAGFGTGHRLGPQHRHGGAQLRRKMRVRTVLTAAALALAGCVSVPPETAPPAASPGGRAPAAPQPSRLSAETAAYYAQVERNLIARGLMRTDGGGPDAPFGTRQVIET